MTLPAISSAPLKGFLDGGCPECENKGPKGNLFKIAFEVDEKAVQVCFCSNGHFWPAGCDRPAIKKNPNESESTSQSMDSTSSVDEENIVIVDDVDGVADSTTQAAEVKFVSIKSSFP